MRIPTKCQPDNQVPGVGSFRIVPSCSFLARLITSPVTMNGVNGHTSPEFHLEDFPVDSAHRRMRVAVSAYKSSSCLKYGLTRSQWAAASAVSLPVSGFNSASPTAISRSTRRMAMSAEPGAPPFDLLETCTDETPTGMKTSESLAGVQNVKKLILFRQISRTSLRCSSVDCLLDPC